MDEELQIKLLFEKMIKVRPFENLDTINETNKGMGFILYYLYKNQKDISSIDIANALKVSTARMAVLLKKLEVANLIKKIPSQEDRRKIIVKLTNDGIKKADEEIKIVKKSLKKIIEYVGYEDLDYFINICMKIKEAINS